MNKRSVKRKPAKTSRTIGVHKSVSRRVVSEPAKAVPISTITVPHQAVAGPVPQQVIGAPRSLLRAHKFRVGQTVLYTSSPVSRPGASGTYKVVKLLPSDGDDYQYRIKNSGEAFERVAKESQLELDH